MRIYRNEYLKEKIFVWEQKNLRKISREDFRDWEKFVIKEAVRKQEIEERRQYTQQKVSMD